MCNDFVVEARSALCPISARWRQDVGFSVLDGARTWDFGRDACVLPCMCPAMQA